MTPKEPASAPKINTELAAGLCCDTPPVEPMPDYYEKREQFYAVKPMPEQFPDLPVAQS